MNEEKTVQRSELYAQVWRQSTVQLAKKYCISDVGLAKLCRKHNIPRPPRGFWARKQAGQLPEQIELPDPKNDYAIAMRDPSQVTPSTPQISAEAQSELDKARGGDSPIEVAATLRGAHALVAKANESLQGAEKDDYGRLVAPRDAGLDVNVSKSQLRRALLIMDALLKAFEKSGYRIVAGPKVELMGVQVAFGIEESLERKREEPGEHDLEGSYRFGHSRYTESRTPSGKLALKIDGPSYWSNHCRKTWSDGKSPLEERLDRFVEGVIKFAAMLKEQQAKEALREQERQEEERRRQENAKRRAEKRALIKAERKRVNELYREAKSWKRSQALRELVEAKQRNASPGDKDLAAWAEWALQQADRLDPLQESPPSILDEDTPELREPEPWRPRQW